MFGFVVARGKYYLIYQLTITITVDISVDHNNYPYTSQLKKWQRAKFGTTVPTILVGRLYSLNIMLEKWLGV